MKPTAAQRLGNNLAFGWRPREAAEPGVERWPSWTTYALDKLVDGAWVRMAYSDGIDGVARTADAVGGECRAVRRNGTVVRMWSEGIVIGGAA